MTATNHGLVGALIGAVLPLPIAVPLAFGSHFVLDSLPHYGIPHSERNHSRTYHFILLADIAAALSLAIAMAVQGKWNMEITAWTAFIPDAIWVQYYFKHRNLHIVPTNTFMRFHQRIQRFERPWGIAVDLLTFAFLLPLFLKQLFKN